MALKTYDELLDLAEQLGDLSASATALEQKALIHKRMGEASHAYDLYQKALATVRRIDMPYQEACILLNLILLLHAQREREEGLQRCNEALAVLARVDAPDIEATILHLKGNFLHNKRWLPQAEEAFRKCIEVHHRLDKPVQLSNALSDFALALYDMQRPDESAVLLRQARDLARRAKDRESIAHADQVEQIIRLKL